MAAQPVSIVSAGVCTPVGLSLAEAAASARGRVARLRELSPLWEMYKDGVDLSTIQWSAH